MLQRAYQRGVLGATFEELLEDFERDLAQLWVVHNGDKIVAAFATSIETTRDTKFCVVRAIGGSRMREWIHLIKVLERHAKDIGCDALRITGRKGWARILKRYTQPFVVLEMRL